MKTMQTPTSLRTSGDTHLKIPGCMGFSSAHTLINCERAQRGRSAFIRSVVLDRICFLHAKKMAQECQLAHTVDNSTELQDLVHSEYAGETIQRGPTVETMHLEAMKARRSAYKNIIGKKFREFGMATAKGDDGKLYMCQLFRGDPKNGPSWLDMIIESSQSVDAEEQLPSTPQLLGKLARPTTFQERAKSLAEEDLIEVPEVGHGIGEAGDEDESSSSDR